MYDDQSDADSIIEMPEDNSQENLFTNPQYQEEPSEEKLSDLGDDEEIDLDNLDALMGEKKPKIFTNEKPYIFTKNKERADVYIKNYLMKFDMQKSLKIL